MTTRWKLPTFRGNPHCSATALSCSGTINLSTSTPTIPPGDYPCVVITADISTLTVTPTSFTGNNNFAFRQWIDLEVTWEIKIANTGSPDVSNESHWNHIPDNWGVKLPGPPGEWVMELAGQNASNDFSVYTQQVGPECFIPIETAGTYRVKATMRLPNGGSFVTTTSATTFTASNFSGTVYYFDADNGNNANNGLSSGAPKQTGFEAILEGGTNRAVLLKYGTTAKHETSAINCRTAIGNHIGMWGSSARGQRAEIIMQAGTNTPLTYNNNDATQSGNNTYCNVNFDLNNSSAFIMSIFFGHASTAIRHLTFYNISCSNHQSSTSGVLLNTSGGSRLEAKGIHLFKCDFVQSGANAAKHAMFLSGWDCVSVVACYFNGNGSNSVLDHHAYLSGNKNQLVTLNYFHTGPNRSFAMNGNTGTNADRWVASLNYINGVMRGFDCSGSNNARTDPNQADNLVEVNFAKNLTDNLCWGYNSTHFTVRYNVVVEGSLGPINTTSSNTNADTLHNVRVYNNLQYCSSNNRSIYIIPDGIQASVMVKNNKAFNNSSSPILAALNTSYIPTYSYDISGNEYYAPNRSSSNIFQNKVFNGTDVNIDFATWQSAGADTSGSLRTTSFDWLDPSNGDFYTANDLISGGGGGSKRVSMLLGIGRRSGGSSSVQALFQSVNANGWSVTYNSPPTFNPSASPEYFTVSREGYDTTGSTATYSQNLVCTQRIRQVYPNQASLTTDQVAVSDYIYSTDTINGVTNNSTESSPKPIANWSMPDRKIIGDTLYVEVVAFHRNARLREQVACVEFTVSDGTNTVTQKVSTSSLSTLYTSIGQKVVVYSASINVSSLANPATLTVNAKVYPWIGNSSSILDSTTLSLPRELSPRTFRRDTAFTPRVAYVRTAANGGNDGTGVVSTTPATASANPFATVLAAINAHHTAGGMDGAIIYIGNDGGTPFVLSSTSATRTQSHSECIITREPGVARANARVSFGAAAFRARFGTAGGWLRFYDVGIDRTGVTQIQGEIASTLQIIFDEVSYVGNSHNATVNNANAQAWFGGCDFISLGASTLNSFTGNTTRCIRNCTFAPTSGIEGWLLLGNTITSPLGSINYANTSPSGSICAFNYITNPSSTNPIMVNDGTTATGMVFVQNVVEYLSATTAPALRLAGDSATNNLTHVCIHHNTFVGFHNNGRANIFYDEGATPRTCKLQSCVGNIHVSINTKGDVFVTDGSRVGNWGYLYGVGCRHEFSQFIDANSGGIGTSFAQAYPGLGANIGTSATVRNDPLFTNYQGTTSGPTAGAGNGTYTLNALSPCKNMVTSPVLKYDIAGNSRSTSSATAGAYE